MYLYIFIASCRIALHHDAEGRKMVRVARLGQISTPQSGNPDHDEAVQNGPAAISATNTTSLILFVSSFLSTFDIEPVN